MAWADKFRKLKVRTNADTPADAKKARELGAEGIGLCRTEHMFFEEDRIALKREKLLSTRSCLISRATSRLSTKLSRAAP